MKMNFSVCGVVWKFYFRAPGGEKFDERAMIHVAHLLSCVLTELLAFLPLWGRDSWKSDRWRRGMIDRKGEHTERQEKISTNANACPAVVLGSLIRRWWVIHHLPYFYGAYSRAQHRSSHCYEGGISKPFAFAAFLPVAEKVSTEISITLLWLAARVGY